MLKVLVVDDEPKVRRGVSGLIEAYPDKYELMGSCADAEGVIGFLEKAIPDVIVTDICMPKQDGLELIYYLKHRYHNLDFIILSGYGDFEYAKKALQYQVFDFLLKPLRPEKLYEALDGVFERRKNSRITKAESMEDNCFFHLIRSGEKEAEEKHLKALGLYDRKGTYRVGIFDLGDIPAVCRAGIEPQKLAEQAGLPVPEYIFTCFEYQIVFAWNTEPEETALRTALRELEKDLGGAVYLGISRKMEGCLEFRKMYFQALDAVKQHIYNKKQRLYFSEKVAGSERLVFPDEVCDRLLGAIRLGNAKRTEQMTETLLGYYRENACHILLLKRHLLLLQKRIEMLSEELGMERSRAKVLLDFVRNIEEVNHFEEILEFWKDNLRQMAQETASAAERKMNSFYLDQILSYIQKNYNQNLSLEDVAEHVNLSVGYLGNYFKQKTGMNFTDYLGQLRLEKAKELLLHSNQKIYRIAELVGYQNSQYFVTAFKKKVGLTPMEYRKCLTESDTVH